MKAAIQLCSSSTASNMLQFFPEKYADDSLYDEFFKITNAFDANLVGCALFDRLVDCSKIIFPIITDDGFCMSFNSMNLKDFTTNE